MNAIVQRISNQRPPFKSMHIRNWKLCPIILIYCNDFYWIIKLYTSSTTSPSASVSVSCIMKTSESYWLNLECLENSFEDPSFNSSNGLYLWCTPSFGDVLHFLLWLAFSVRKSFLPWRFWNILLASTFLRDIALANYFTKREVNTPRSYALREEIFAEFNLANLGVIREIKFRETHQNC